VKKKNIIFLLFCFLCLFSFNLSVKAVETECTATVKINRQKSLMWYGNEFIRIYWMELGGKTALCADHSKGMSSGTKLVVGGCDGKVAITSNMKKALNYCIAKGCDTELEKVSAQLYAWGASYEEILQSYCTGFYQGNDGYLSCVGNSLIKNGLRWIYNDLGKTSTSGEFVCNYGGTAKQPLITIGRPICENSLVCPPGTKNAGKDITAEAEKVGYEVAVQNLCGDEENVCFGYQVNLTGSLNACSDNNSNTYSFFREEVGNRGASYSGSENGRKIDVNIGNGEYCALYCLETSAEAVLPGGLANAIAKGSALTWPTSEKTSSSKWGNMFPVEFSGKKRCKIQVAPNLTYGNSCNLDPVEQYKNYLKTLKDRYNSDKNFNYNSLVGNANAANGAVRLNDSSVGLSFNVSKIENVGNLRKTGEQIRIYDGKTTYFNNFQTYNPKSGMLNYYINIANTNSSTAESAYNTAWNTYCRKNPSTSANAVYVPDYDSPQYNDPTDPLKITGYDDKFSHYECSHGRSGGGDRDICYCNESWANAKSSSVSTMKAYMKNWQAFRSSINSRANVYSNYITAYKNALGLYQQIKYCSEYTFNCGGDSCDFYNFQTGASMEYTDENEYGTTYPLNIENSTKYECDTCGSQVEMKPTDSLLANDGYNLTINNYNDSYLANRITAIEDKTMNIEAKKTTYSLPSGLYNYINKDNNKFVMTKPSGNYIVLGLDKNGGFKYSNLPTSFNNKVGKKYNLVIKDIQLGDNGQYTAGAEGVSIGNYVCHYHVSADDNECLCPPGTKHDGIDLYQALLNSNGSLTCADAKLRYCNGDNIPKCEINCIEDKYCDNNPTIKITSCINSGKSKSECESLLCGLNNYVCDNNTPLAGMDMTSCVQTRVALGYSLNSARSYCNRNFCSAKNMFIYRTIDLRNPFPSIDADKTINQTNLNYGMFNLNVKGRYPGYNWNGTGVVRTEIIQNRNTNDYDVYNKKPLYHFELDTATILEIREYNKKQAQNDDGYNDFTLSCVRDADNKYLGTSCLSRFVHDVKYGGDTTGNESLCGGAGSTTTLAKCLYDASNS